MTESKGYQPHVDDKESGTLIDEMDFVLARARREMENQNVFPVYPSAQNELMEMRTQKRDSLSIIFILLALAFFLLCFLMIGYVDSENLFFIYVLTDQAIGLYVTLALLITIMLLLSVYHQMDRLKAVWNKMIFPFHIRAQKWIKSCYENDDSQDSI